MFISIEIKDASGSWSLGMVLVVRTPTAQHVDDKFVTSPTLFRLKINQTGTVRIKSFDAAFQYNLITFTFYKDLRSILFRQLLGPEAGLRLFTHIANQVLHSRRQDGDSSHSVVQIVNLRSYSCPPLVIFPINMAAYNIPILCIF